MLEINKIHQGDCLDLMHWIKDKSVDMILCDLPYGTTECKWDNIINLEILWKQYKRIITDSGIIALTCTEPFSSSLLKYGKDIFKYDWIWIKSNSTGFLNAKVRPMRKHENILIFSKSPITSTSNKTIYNPQGLIPTKKIKKNFNTESFGKRKSRENGSTYLQKMTNYPTTILEFGYDKEKLHPTQKPLSLGRYLVKTYTNKGDLVLDNCCGSGSFPLSAKIENRNFIGIELDEKYCKIANERLKQENLINIFEQEKGQNK